MTTLTGFVLVLAAFMVFFGTAMHVFAYYTETKPESDGASRDAPLWWLVDPVIWKNDKDTERPGILRARATRRRRSGWMWLFLGTLFTAMYTFVGWLEGL